MVVPPSTTAAAVSSHDVSMPSTRTMGRSEVPFTAPTLGPVAAPGRHAYRGVWQTASTLLPSGSRTKAP